MKARHLVKELISLGVKDVKVIDAIRKVERDKFVPSEFRDFAWSDKPLPIGYGQTISQPFIVAIMTQMLNLQPDMQVLEIGTGSGYQAAILAQLCKHVYTIERIKPLAEFANSNLRSTNVDNVTVKYDDGTTGWPEYAPFDRIIVTAGSVDIPQSLVKQMTSTGIMIIPLKDAISGTEELAKVTKISDAEYRVEKFMSVRFVPLLQGKV